MKKFFSLAIFAIMMIAPMFLSSCGDDDLVPDDNQEQVMTEWTEPFHVKNSSVEEVKTYMASSMKSHRLVVSTAKRFAKLFKNEMCFSPPKTKCDLKSNLSAKKQHLKRQKLAQKAS